MSDQPLDVLDPRKKQIFPIVYPGMGQLLQGQTPSGATGAIANIEIPVANFPMMLTGVRLLNVYDVPEELQANLPYLGLLDSQQTVQTKLTQQNIIVRPTMQNLVTGGNNFAAAGAPHWHPFEAPYPFRGGNNINFEVQRVTDYPDTITNIVVHAAIVGWAYMSDAFPDAAPGSTGYPSR